MRNKQGGKNINNHKKKEDVLGVGTVHADENASNATQHKRAREQTGARSACRPRSPRTYH